MYDVMQSVVPTRPSRVDVSEHKTFCWILKRLEETRISCKRPSISRDSAGFGSLRLPSLGFELLKPVKVYTHAHTKYLLQSHRALLLRLGSCCAVKCDAFRVGSDQCIWRFSHHNGFYFGVSMVPSFVHSSCRSKYDTSHHQPFHAHTGVC